MKNVDVTTITFLMSGDLTGLCLYMQEGTGERKREMKRMADQRKEKGEGERRLKRERERK